MILFTYAVLQSICSPYMRNITLDVTRTLAIVLMVIFHFIYDLKYFSYVDWDIPDGGGWRIFRMLIISLFFLCLGASLSFTHHTKFKVAKFLKRTSQIALAAFVISIVSYFAIPQNWIFFGVLHFLALSSLIVVGLVRHPLLCLLIGLGLLIFGALQILPSRWPFNLLFDGLPYYTNDYVSIQPWLGMVFLGVPLAHWYLFKYDPLAKVVQNANESTQKWLMWPGQHSLSIYIVHQPILMGALWLLGAANLYISK